MPTLTSEISGHSAHFRYLAFATIVLAVSLTMLMLPFAAFFVTIFLLINLPSETPRATRMLLGLAAALSLSLMAGSRPVMFSDFSDTDVYYDVYRSINDGNMSSIWTFGGGFEVGLPILFYIFSILLPELSINGMMFFTALASSLVLLNWLERNCRGGPDFNRPLLIGLSFLMINLYFSTQLTRQFLSLIILLYAFSEQNWYKRFIYMLIASAFHLTAIPFFLLYVFSTRWRWGWLALIVTALLLRMYLAQILSAVGILPPALAEKLAYYIGNNSGYTDADLGSLKIIVLLSLISFATLVMARFRVSLRTRSWLAVPWITGAVHLVLLPIPLMSLRTTLLVHAVIPGYLIFKMIDDRTPTMAMVVPNLLLCYKIVSFVTAEQSGNLLTTFMMVHGFFL